MQKCNMYIFITVLLVGGAQKLVLFVETAKQNLAWCPNCLVPVPALVASATTAWCSSTWTTQGTMTLCDWRRPWDVHLLQYIASGWDLVWYWFVHATSVDQMEKILVKWCCSRFSRTMSLVKRTAVKEGMIAVGQKVTVVWVKLKKTYQAEVVSVGDAQTLAPRTAFRSEGEVFTFELAAPTQQTSRAMSTATGDRRPSVNQQYQYLQQLS